MRTPGRAMPSPRGTPRGGTVGATCFARRWPKESACGGCRTAHGSRGRSRPALSRLHAPRAAHRAASVRRGDVRLLPFSQSAPGFCCCERSPGRPHEACPPAGRFFRLITGVVRRLARGMFIRYCSIRSWHHFAAKSAALRLCDLQRQGGFRVQDAGCAEGVPGAHRRSAGRDLEIRKPLLNKKL